MNRNFTIVELNEELKPAFCACLTPDDPALKEAGDMKKEWLARQQPDDFGARVALSPEGIPCGMIQYLPADRSGIEGPGLWFVFCIWIPDRKRNPAGNLRRTGMGRALLAAAEEDVRSRGADGVVAWGTPLPFFMKSSWFKKQGYRLADKKGIMELCWKPFNERALSPFWKNPGWADSDIKQVAGSKAKVTAYVNGICPAMNMVHNRFVRAVGEMDGKVVLESITPARTDAVLINGREFPMGPPPSYKKILKALKRAIK
jgi:hypothetical protein